MDELKTCPFCGRQATRMPFIDDEYKQIRYIGCDKCCVVSFIGVSNDEVVEAWNTRAEPSLVAKITIPNEKLEKIKDECMDYVKSCIEERTCEGCKWLDNPGSPIICRDECARAKVDYYTRSEE